MKKKKITYIFGFGLILIFVLCIVGLTFQTKETYSASNKCYQTDHGEECLDLGENTVYGKYTLVEPDTGRYQWQEWSIKFTAGTDKVFDKLKVSTNIITQYSHLYYVSGKDEYKVATRMENNAYNDDWHWNDYTYDSDIYVIEPTTLTEKEYKNFEIYTNPYNTCQYNEPSNTFVWTNINIGYSLLRYGLGFVDADKCVNKRSLTLHDEDEIITLGGKKSPHYFYEFGDDSAKKSAFNDGDEIKISSLNDEFNFSADTVREGYTLSWNTKADGSGKKYSHDETFKLESNLELYAIWESKGYEVKYNANGGYGAPPSQAKIHNVDLTLSSKKPTTMIASDIATYFPFMHWNTKKDGSGTIYHPGSKYQRNESMTLYAQWGYKITYNANGGVADKTEDTILQGKSLKLPNAKRDCFIFVGWYTGLTGGTSVGKNNVSYTPTRNITLYAHWKEDTLLCPPDPVPPCVGDSCTPDPEPEPGPTPTPTPDPTPTPEPGSKTYVVTYSGNASEFVRYLPGTQYKQHGKSLKLSTKIPYRFGYKFTEWNVKTDGSGISYDVGDVYNKNADLILYAQWVSYTDGNRCTIRE